MMDLMPNLRTTLMDLLYELRDNDLPLIIGGGYGIYLKREYILELGMRTLLRELPESRSTNDIDLFLRPELLINSEQLRPLAETLLRLGYTPIPGAEKYQFIKQGPQGDVPGSIKIDLLTGPRARFENTKALVDDRRVRPRPSVDLHAHHVDEAITLEDDLLPLRFEGVTSNATSYSSTVYLPHALTFCMMKLFAFRDRMNDREKAYGQYHALDIYSIIATTGEAEWNRALELVETHKCKPEIVEAHRIVGQYFSTLTSVGMLRMRESPYCRKELELQEFCNALGELFQAAVQSEGF